MQLSDLDISKTYSYADYLTCKFDEWVEIIKGKLFPMSPMPVTKHQLILGNLFAKFYIHLKGKQYQVFHPPFDVRLPRSGETDDNQIFTVVQPDITIVCDIKKLDRKGCLGAPDMIIEILSPSSAKKDTHNKLDIYEEAGVKEYWIVHPQDETLLVHTLSNENKYIVHRLYTKGDNVKLSIFEDFYISLDEVFDVIQID